MHTCGVEEDLGPPYDFPDALENLAQVKSTAHTRGRV